MQRVGFGRDLDLPPVPDFPPGVSVDENIRLSLLHRGDLWWWVKRVMPASWPFGPHPWDYKQCAGVQYARFGNFNYGATGYAQGLPLAVLLRASGWVQWLHAGGGCNWVRSVVGLKGGYSAEWGVPWGPFPYGDDPELDAPQIIAGYHYARAKLAS